MTNPDQQLDELITGTRYGWKCYEGCIGNRYAILKKFPRVSRYICKFEHLIGIEGGSDRESQILELMNLASFLDYSLTYHEAEKIANQLFGDTRTFRVGKKDRWKTVFKNSHVDLYKTLYGDVLIGYGYERDFNW